MRGKEEQPIKARLLHEENEMSEWRTACEWQEIAVEARPKVRYWVPGAAVDEEDLIRELRLLKERGFGGVEVVPLVGTPDEIVRGEDGWGTTHWNHVIAVIEKTLRELGMSMDIANGPMWPISMPGIGSADDPAALYELTWGVLDIGPEGRYAGPLPERRVQREEGTPRLLHVFAYQQNAEGALAEASYTDLRAQLRGEDQMGDVDVVLPRAQEGCSWLLFAFYEQPSAQKTGNGRYYVIDHLSPAGAAACGAYWESLFEAAGELPAMESIFCDSLEYNVALDWSRGFAGEFEKRRGYSILPYLPFIGYKGTYPESDAPGYRLDHAEISDMAGQDYLETVTQCHCEYHLGALESMAEQFGKTIRCQVAYNKPFDEERCPLYVEIPENEALGRPSMDGLKTMAAAAHLGRKKRYSFECAAEFGNCYGQNYEDLFWWVKRSLMSGMNAQVLHGASYSGGYHGQYSRDGMMKGVEWPGYEAFWKVVSNNWNRTPSVTDARGCLDTIARLNTLFLQQALVDCAVYRSSYCNDGLESEFSHWKDGGRLANAGYSYETLSAALLEHPNARVKGGLLDPEGAAYQCLLIPPQETVSTGLLQQVQRLLAEGLPVIWFGEKPRGAQYYSEWRSPAQRESWRRLLDAVWNDARLLHAGCVEDAVSVLRENGIRPRAELGGGMDLVTAVHQADGKDARYYAVYGYNRIEYSPEEPNPEEIAVSSLYRKGSTKSTYERPGRGSRREVAVSLDAAGQVFLLDPWSGQERPLSFTERDGRMEGTISMEEDELVLLAVRGEACLSGAAAGPGDLDVSLGSAGEAPLGNGDGAAAAGAEREIPVQFDTLFLQEFRPDSEGEKSFLRSSFSEEGRIIELTDLKPWYELDPDLETFAGKGTYRGTLDIGPKEDGKRYVLCLGDVCDTFTVKINGEDTVFPDQVMKEVEITDLVREGRNEIEVCVVSNLFNRLQKGLCIPGTEFPMPYRPKPYGIHEREGRNCCLRIL